MSPDFPSVFYLANAGLYLTDHRTGILVDGLFDPHEGFDSLPESITAAIIKKESPFNSLTTLLFTHTHPDHYSPEKVTSFLRLYPDTTLLLPEIPPFGGLYPIPCRHLLDRGKIVPHCSFFLKYAGRNFFFSGDADPVWLNRNISPELLMGFQSKIHMAFVNPFFFFLTPGRRFLAGLNPEQIYVYHMPVRVPDLMRYHEILEQGLSKYPDKTVKPLLNFMCKLQ